MELTAARVSTTVELPVIFVRYFFVCPALMLGVVSWGERMEADWSSFLTAVLVLSLAHAAMVRLRERGWREQQQRVDMIEDGSVLPGLGLRT